MKITIYRGDALERLRDIPDESIHCVVTSPPYWGLRDYGHQGMVGLEPTFEEHLESLLGIFAEVQRVLRKDGTFWLNYGDAYTAAGRGEGSDLRNTKQITDEGSLGSVRQKEKPMNLPRKNLMGMPWRIAFALQERQGWILRSEIIWHKPNSFCENVADRPTQAHEKIFLFTKTDKYFYDADPVRTPYKESSSKDKRDNQDGHRRNRAYPGAVDNGGTNLGGNRHGGANLRNVWSVPTRGFSGAHFAVFPEKLIEPCLLTGTSAYGVCPDCGAPWERVKKRSGGPPSGDHRKNPDFNHAAKAAHDTGTVDGAGLSGTYRKYGYAKIETIGWRPTCSCYNSLYEKFPKPKNHRKRHQRVEMLYPSWWERVRARPGRSDWPHNNALVLDPFAGAATTALAAAKLGRNAALIEISPEYIQIAKDRIFAELGPMFIEWEEADPSTE